MNVAATLYGDRVRGDETLLMPDGMYVAASLPAI